MYNMKKKLVLFYASEKEARYYLRHLNYGFIYTQDRTGNNIVVENVPLLPRVDLNKIGILHKVEMPAEQQEKRFLQPSDDSANSNINVSINPPAMAVSARRQQLDLNRRILFSTDTSSTEACNLQEFRSHPYARQQTDSQKQPHIDIVRLNACSDSSSATSSTSSSMFNTYSQSSTSLPSRPPSTFPPLPTLFESSNFTSAPFDAAILRPPSSSVDVTSSGDGDGDDPMCQVQQQQLYSNSNLSIGSLDEGACEMPTTSSQAAANAAAARATEESNVVLAARSLSQFEGKLTNPAVNNDALVEAVQKKLGLSPTR